MTVEIVPPCCGEHTCQRSQPIRVLRSGLTGTWYVVTQYAVRGNGAVEAAQKHQMHPDDAAALEAAFQAESATRKAASGG